MVTPDGPGATAQLGQVETGGKDPDDNMRAGKNPTRTLTGVRRQNLPYRGPYNLPQAPVEKPQGEAAEQGLRQGTVGIFHVNRTAMRLTQAGDRGLGAELWVVWEKPDQ